MIRRKFIQTLSAGTLVATTPLMATSCQNKDETKLLVEKVKMAMLTMQRASWEQGVAAQALWESGDTELALLLAKEAVLRQTAEGRLSVLYTDNGVTDPAASGEVVYRLGIDRNNKELSDAAAKMLDYLLITAPKNENGILYHTLNAPEIWIDSMYMAPPFLCIAGQPGEAIKQVNGFRKYLWNEEYKLYSHRFHVGENRFINEKFWGVGNGWALAAMARLIDDLPQTMRSEKEQLINYVHENLEGCLKYLRSDGLFHDTINDPDSFVETNLSQMVAYTIFRGIKSKWLEHTYIDKALLMRKAAYKKVDEFGYVQGACGAPWFNSQGRATESQAFFLLMESSYEKLNQ